VTSTVEIELTFDEFGWRALEHRASAEGVAPAQLVSLACAYHESQLAEDRVAAAVPRFRRRAVDGETRALGIELEDLTFQRLEQEAERQGVSPERLCEHAVLLYLADLDSGKVAERIARHAGSDRD
jgi:hypothetical protein